jgi:isopentenyldiphosphate isomerase/intracellular septation protein A
VNPLNTNKLGILKQLLPGIIPLLVYIIADAIFGELWGMIIAAGLSIVEFAVIYFRSKVADKFVLFDLALVAIFGGISVWSNNPIFFKLKPAIIELTLAGLMGIALFININLLVKFVHRYFPTMKLSEIQMQQMRKSIKWLFWIICFHIGTIVYSAYFLPKEIWAFTSSIGLYILFGIWFCFELLNKKRQQAKYKKLYKDEEWLDLVDSDSNKIGEAPRSICHSRPGYMHSVVHLHIFSRNGGLYLQHRNPDRLVQPGKWDSAVGGHVSRGETVPDALLRETYEEIGLRNFNPRALFRYVWETAVETEMVHTFITVLDFEPVFDKSEMDDFKLWKIADIKRNLGKNIFTPNFEHEFKLLEKTLK